MSIEVSHFEEKGGSSSWLNQILPFILALLPWKVFFLRGIWGFLSCRQIPTWPKARLASCTASSHSFLPVQAGKIELEQDELF